MKFTVGELDFKPLTQHHVAMRLSAAVQVVKRTQASAAGAPGCYSPSPLGAARVAGLAVVCQQQLDAQPRGALVAIDVRQRVQLAAGALLAGIVL